MVMRGPMVQVSDEDFLVITSYRITFIIGPGTPPLPDLSPSHSPNNTPQSSPDFRVKYKMNQSTSNLNRPDLLENETVKKNQRDAKTMSAAIRRAASINTENQNIKDR